MEMEASEEPQSPPSKTTGNEGNEGRFSFSDVYNYLRYQQYPEGASKLEKNSLRRRSKYFRLQNEDLYYIGGGKLNLCVCHQQYVY